MAFAVRAIAWRKSGRFPTRFGITVGAMALLAVVADVLTWVVGWRETTNEVRFATGLGGGSAMAIFLYPLLRLIAHGPRQTGHRHAQLREWAVPIASGVALGWGLLLSGSDAAGWGAVGLAVAGLAALWTSLNAMLGIVIVGRQGRIIGMKAFMVLFAVSVCAAALEFLISSQMHDWVVARVMALG